MICEIEYVMAQINGRIETHVKVLAIGLIAKMTPKNPMIRAVTLCRPTFSLSKIEANTAVMSGAAKIIVETLASDIKGKAV
tara:strand:- start:207 stop:449 length:243 start_codon:yes stop_codon:yes gene_type:complete